MFVNFCVIYQRNKKVLTPETPFNKSISVSGSSNAVVWGRSPQPSEANGGLVAVGSPRALRRFYSLFS